MLVQILSDAGWLQTVVWFRRKHTDFTQALESISVWQGEPVQKKMVQVTRLEHSLPVGPFRQSLISDCKLAHHQRVRYGNFVSNASPGLMRELWSDSSGSLTAAPIAI